MAKVCQVSERRLVHNLYVNSGGTSGIGDKISRITAKSAACTQPNDNNVYAAYSYNGFGRTVVEDIQRVIAHLAFKVRCQDIAVLYNEQPGAKKACMECLCSPNAKPTKGVGWTGLTPKNELHETFK